MSDPVLIALIVATPPTLIALGALIVSLRNGKKVDVLHVIVNSRLSELLTQSKAAARAEGAQNERDRKERA